MEEYLVLLHSHEDLDTFYADMETTGGILERAIDICCRRPLSRTTMYMLTSEEAAAVKADSRVRQVARWSDRPEMKPTAFTRTDFEYDKGANEPPNDSQSKNWGTWRSRNTYEGNESIIDNWADDFLNPDQVTGEKYIGSETFTETGKHVDIVVKDGHPDPNMPDLQINADGTGGSRVNEINWNLYTTTVQGYEAFGSSDYFLRQDYQYSPYTSVNSDISRQRQHGASVSTCAAGSTLGLAPGANIYSFDPYTASQQDYGNFDPTDGYPNYTDFDYIRAWHNAKTVNPATGFKNPTIINCSTGFNELFSEGDNTWPVQATNRGVTYGDGINPMTNQQVEDAQLAGVGDIVGSAGNRYFYSVLGTNGSNSFIDFVIADVEDCINDGIHVVISASNDNTLMAFTNTTEHTNNTVTLQDATTQNWKSRSFGTDQKGCYIVGTLSTKSRLRAGGSAGQGECRVSYSNCGLGVDFYTFADGVTAGYNGNGGQVADPRNASYTLRTFNGTSAGAPMLTGQLACILERFPDMTPAQLYDYMVFRSRDVANDNEAGDLGNDWPNAFCFESTESPRVAMTIGDIRPQSGRIETKNIHLARPSSGVAYPRQRTARTWRRVV